MLFFTVLCSERLVIPGAITIVVVVGNRTSNPLSARVASDDANALSIRFQDRLNGAGIVELKEVAVGGTGRKTRATRDATAGNLHQERRIGRLQYTSVSVPSLLGEADTPLSFCSSTTILFCSRLAISSHLKGWLQRHHIQNESGFGFCDHVSHAGIHPARRHHPLPSSNQSSQEILILRSECKRTEA